MPEISRFFGIIVAIYHNDHPPPHFHAKYGEHKAKLTIATGEVIAGSLPSRAYALVEEWRLAHLAELQECWNRAAMHQAPGKIDPLE